MTSLEYFRFHPLGSVLAGLFPAQVKYYRPSLLLGSCASMLICALLLGGGTHGGFLSDAILELLAIPVLIISVSSLVALPVWRSKTRPELFWLLSFCIGLPLIPLLQLIPLPPTVWTRLPGRDVADSVLALIGAKPWLPLSMSPHATWLSVLSLLPPIAIFIAAVQLGYRDRRVLSLIIIAIGVLSAFVGMMQVAQGQSSPLRFFAITNPTEAVGFFANRNHFAALLYAVLLLAAVWAIDLGFKINSWTDLRAISGGRLVGLTALFLIVIVLIAGEAMARSRAGLALTIVALLAIYGLAFFDRRNGSGANPGKILLLVASLAVVFSMQFALYRILARFGTDSLEASRMAFARDTIEAARAFMPFGSGSGTFVPVYQIFEKPGDLIPGTFVNHAHDDFLEVWLETGVMGAVLLGLFFVWLGRAVSRVWRRPTRMLPFDCTLARAASVIIVLLMLHSAVDYPTRTDAIMAVFAVCCAFLIEPLRHGELDTAATAEIASRDVELRQEAAKLAAAFAPSPPRPASQPALWTPDAGRHDAPHSSGRWGEGIEWPEEWQTIGGGKRPDAIGTQPAEPANTSDATAGEDNGSGTERKLSE